jgi:hypothetical protein
VIAIADFAAPIGSASSARLVFASGAAGINLYADPALSDLYRARFTRHIPSVRVQGGAVTIQFRSFSFFDWLVYWREPVGEVKLNCALPWEIESRGGVSKLTADLSRLRLIAFDVNGGASEVVMTLPQPTGAAYIRIAGGASNITFRRPAGVAMRVRIGSGASNLALDDQRFAAVAGKMIWETPEYKDTTHRYDLEIVGGASDLTIGTY